MKGTQTRHIQKKSLLFCKLITRETHADSSKN